MGDHAFFVWSSYGVTAVVITGLIVWILRGHAKARAAVRNLDRESRS